MEYQKFKADYLFNGLDMLGSEHVLVTDVDGKIKDIIKEKDAGNNVQIHKGIISPGFINAHCHLELSHLHKRIPEKTGLVNFVTKVVAERHFPEEDITAAISKAEAFMLAEGIAAVGDICNTTLTIKQKEKKNLGYYNFIETSGWSPHVAEVRYEQSRKKIEEFLANGFPASIVPHAPYSVSDELWGKLTPYFSHKVISIHNQETKHEDEFFLYGTGDFNKMYAMMQIDNSFYLPKEIRSVTTYYKKLAAADSVILVHNTFTQQEDVDYINENKPPHQRVSFCLCANANLYIENVLPPVELFLKNECNIIVGTDSLGSNHQLSILEELKTIAKNFKNIPAKLLLQWATINGARALQMDEKLGSFEKNKRPGIILIEKINGGNLTEASVARKLL